MKIQTRFWSDDGFPEVALTLDMEHFPPGTTTAQYHLIFCKINLENWVLFYCDLYI